MVWTPHMYMYNTLQTPKYLKKGKFVKFLSVKSESPAKLIIYHQDQDHSSRFSFL